MSSSPFSLAIVALAAALVHRASGATAIVPMPDAYRSVSHTPRADHRSCSNDDYCSMYRVGNSTKSVFAKGTQCVADPLHYGKSVTYGSCGFIGAQCSSDDQCDAGSCMQGICRGYFGDPCASSDQCLDLLSCGTDHTCGGGASITFILTSPDAPVGANCGNNNGSYSDYLCTSQSCTSAGSSWQCQDPAMRFPKRLPADFGCTYDQMCQSGVCRDSSNSADPDHFWTCAAPATHKARPSGSHRPQHRKITTWTKRSRSIPADPMPASMPMRRQHQRTRSPWQTCGLGSWSAAWRRVPKAAHRERGACPESTREEGRT